MRFGRWLAWIVAALIVTFALVMLGLMQRQLEELRHERAGVSAGRASRPWPGATGATGATGPEGASGASGASGPRARKKNPDGVPPGALW